MSLRELPPMIFPEQLRQMTRSPIHGVERALASGMKPEKVFERVLAAVGVPKRERRGLVIGVLQEFRAEAARDKADIIAALHDLAGTMRC